MGILARFIDRPAERHYEALLRVLCYLKNTIDYGLFYEFGGICRKQLTAHAHAFDEHMSTSNVHKWNINRVRCIS